MTDLLHRAHRRDADGRLGHPLGVAARRRALRRRRVTRGLVAGGLVASLAVGGVALAAAREPADRYRTALATTASAEQTIDAVGTVASAARADASFSVGGTVGTVDVAVGDTVAAGDLLATLDAGGLEDALEQAESELADAEQTLEDDLESQTATTTSSSSSDTASAPDTSTSGSPSATPTTDPTDPAGGPSAEEPAVTAAIAAVATAQADLLAQYEVVSAALEVSRRSLATSQSVCEVFLSIGVPVDPVDPADPADPADPVDDPATEALTACQAALAVVLTDQEAVDAAQVTLLDLAATLDEAVTAARAALTAAAHDASSGSGSTPSTSTPASSVTAATASTPSASSTQSGSLSQSGAETSVASAADILADRAAIDLAAANVEIARAELGMVSLTSPIAGTVAAVSIAAGDAVTASSTTAVITILGDQGHTVTTTLSLPVIDTVEVGQSVEMAVASTDEALTGQVSSVGILNVSTSSTPAYTVVISVDATQARLFDGASAQIVISVGGNEETLTVPTSAVHVDGTAVTVTVLRDGAPLDVAVQTGAVGSELTEILSGLEVGDEVVLADLTQALISDGTQTDSGLSGLSGSGETQTVIRGEVPAGGMMAPPTGGRPGE